MSTPYNIPSLDGIRACSIALVFIAHVGFGHIVPGGLGVTVFFFLSGYLITMLLAREWDSTGRISLGAFYLRRIVRLGPPIAVTLVGSFALAGLGLAEGEPHLMTILSQVFFFFNYYVIHATEMVTVDGLGILWSLSVEEHFYLIWPALFGLLALRRVGVGPVVGFLIVILVWRGLRFFVLGDSENAIYLSTDSRIDSLLYGCLLAILTWRGQITKIFPPIGAASAVWVSAGVMLLLLCLVIRDDAFRSTLRYSLQGLALMPLFHYAVTQPEKLLWRPLNWRPIQMVGRWSYTIYLAHFVIIKALIYSGVSTSGAPLLIVISAILSVGYAALVYKYVERPLVPLRRRLTGRLRAA